MIPISVGTYICTYMQTVDFKQVLGGLKRKMILKDARKMGVAKNYITMTLDILNERISNDINKQVRHEHRSIAMLYILQNQARVDMRN